MITSDRLFKVASEPLELVLKDLGVGQTAWDWLVVADASGDDDAGCGWAVVTYDRLGREDEARRLWSGAANYGKSLFAETYAFLLPIHWIADVEAERQKRRIEPKRARVHCVTDCQACFDKASRGHPPAGERRGWHPFAQFEDHPDVILLWHLVGRETLGAHCVVDRVSRAARTVYKVAAPAWPVIRNKDGEELKTLYDVNPADRDRAGA